MEKVLDLAGGLVDVYKDTDHYHVVNKTGRLGHFEWHVGDKDGNQWPLDRMRPRRLQPHEILTYLRSHMTQVAREMVGEEVKYTVLFDAGLEAPVDIMALAKARMLRQPVVLMHHTPLNTRVEIVKAFTSTHDGSFITGWEGSNCFQHPATDTPYVAFVEPTLRVHLCKGVTLEWGDIAPDECLEQGGDPLYSGFKPNRAYHCQVRHLDLAVGLGHLDGFYACYLPDLKSAT